MVNIPVGRPMLQVLEGGLSNAASSGGARPRGPALPQAPINSTLQSLNGQQLAELGIGSGLIISAFHTSADPSTLFNDGTVTVTQPNPDGTYGEPGIEYRGWITPAIGDESQWTTWSVLMYGPITPFIQSWSGGDRNAWQFDYFDVNGNPLSAGGTATSSVRRWDAGETPYGFHIFRADDASQQATPQNMGQPLEVPYPAPVPIPLPPSPEEEEDERDFVDLVTDVKDLADAVGDAKTAAEAVADILTEKLTCNICDLVNTRWASDDLWKLWLENQVEEFMRRTTIGINTTIDISGCDEEPDVQAVQGDTVDSLALLMAYVAIVVGKSKESICDDTGCDFAVPEEWASRKAPNTPTMVLRMRESASGHSGTPKPRDISLPNFTGDIAATFPSWTRGDYRGHAYCANGSSIIVFANSQSSCESVLDSLGSFCAGYDPESKNVSFKAGRVENKVLLSPYKTLWFPDGRKSGVKPAQVHNHETGETWP